jgi:uncharacterized membrane protein
MNNLIVSTTTSVNPAPGTAAVRPRLDSIDVLRGLIMVIMALDHVRDYFSGDTMSPEDLSVTTPALFFTRWITHFCAPVFVLLAGTSAYLYGTRGRTKRELSHFLWTRGLWLVVLEVTVVNWAWHFDLSYPRLTFMVIWALGISMIGMAFFVHLPLRWITGIGVAMILGHNLLDGITFAQTDWRFVPWALLHDVPKRLALTSGTTIVFLYPIVPWVGVMAAGYGLGALFQKPPELRQRWLIRLGVGMVAGFILLRLSNLYGDSAHWSVQSSGVFTLMSFLNCSKYPPSLLYLLMTLGPALLLLAFMERRPRWQPAWLVIYGRVPMFYYLLHLYLLHLGAGLTALFLGRAGHAQWVLGSSFNMNRPEDYGYPLWAVYLAWIIIVAMLYLPCRWYAGVKQRNRSPWLSYL